LPGRSAALDSGKLRNAARGVGEGVEVFDHGLEVGDEPFNVEKTPRGVASSSSRRSTIAPALEQNVRRRSPL
jgi:hypothetical protein